MPLLHLILPGARAPDRLAAGIAAAIGIALTALVSGLAIRGGIASPWLVAPMGASAVLVFAVPASPLAQPWPVIGGNALSALAGIAAAHWLPEPALAAGVAVGAAILLMSATGCLHPPGGAAALTAVIGGPAVAAAGWRFALFPVAVNAVLLTAAGWLFHRWSGHSYPHRAGPRAPAPPGFHPEDVDAAIAELGETLDVAREDLDALFARVEEHAARRRGR